MPIKAEPETARAVRAFFTEAAGNNAKTGEADKLRAELAQSQEESAALRGDLYRAANEITELKKFGAMLGDRVEVGCNSVLNPGTVIGRDSSIYPLSMVRGFVPPHSIYKRQGEIVGRV